MVCSPLQHAIERNVHVLPGMTPSAATKPGAPWCGAGAWRLSLHAAVASRMSLHVLGALSMSLHVAGASRMSLQQQRVHQSCCCMRRVHIENVTACGGCIADVRHRIQRVHWERQCMQWVHQECCCILTGVCPPPRRPVQNDQGVRQLQGLQEKDGTVHTHSRQVPILRLRVRHQ
jgi:hypothetical protein